MAEPSKMDPTESIYDTLTKKGWSFENAEAIKTLIRSFHNSLESIEFKLMSTDLRSIGAKSLPDPSSLKKSSHLVGPKVLQVNERQGIGYQRSRTNGKLGLQSLEIDIEYFRSAMTNVFTNVLKVRYFSAGTMRASEIDAEIAEIVPLTINICMSALYAKLRNIDESYGKHGIRYSSTPSYTEEIEMPLPFALAIQDFGVFQTHSLVKNYVVVPTYPEGIEHEGRSKSAYPAAEYLSYLPTLKSLGITMKSVDTRIRAGSPWWTYKVDNQYNTTDLLCTLPRSHYSDLSAIVRSVFCYADAATLQCKDIVSFGPSVVAYGTLMNAMPRGFNTRSFLALIHGPEEEWSFGARLKT